MSRKTLVAAAFTLFLTVAPGISPAQAVSGTQEVADPAFDTNYLADYTGLLTARTFLLFQNASLFIQPAGDRVPPLVYRPNANVRIGLAGFWKWFGLGLSIDNPFYKTDREAYGKTKAIDLRVNAYGRSVAGELFFQQYTGFYMSSPEQSDGTHYIIPGMKTVSVGLAGYWIYNAKRFSIRAAFIQNERQKKSAGSLVVRPSFLFYRISSGEGFIPAGITDAYHIPAEDLVTGGKFYSVGLSPGYVYTLVFLKNFYLTAALFPGVAAQFSTFSNNHEVVTDFAFSFQLSGRFAVGYNSGKWFLGGSVQTGFSEIPQKLNHAMSGYDVTQFRLWGGTRFDLFKKKRKSP